MASSSSPNLPVNQFNRIRPKKPLDIWSTREKLCLASAVYKIGDQNWVSVSRAIKQYADQSRPPDWFHQKNCVLQYFDMLEQLEQPKRKRGDRAESDAPSLQIMRKMTIERSEQLKKEILDMQQEFKQLKSDVEGVEAGDMDDTLEEEWDKIKAELQVKEEDVTVEVTDSEAVDSKDSVLERSLSQGVAGQAETSGLAGSLDTSGLVDVEVQGVSAALSVTSSSLDASVKMATPSHLLSSLLQSDVTKANELQQLKMEQEAGNGASLHATSAAGGPHQQPVAKPHGPGVTATAGLQSDSSNPAASDGVSAGLVVSPSKLPEASTAASRLPTATVPNTTSTESGITAWPAAEGDLEDSHVDVMTEVVEETVATDTNHLLPSSHSVTGSSSSSSSLLQGVTEPKSEEVEEEDESSLRVPVVGDVVGEEVVPMEEVGEPVVKTEAEEEVVVAEEEEEDVKDSTAELDVEGLDQVKEEEVDKESQDEEEEEDDLIADLKPKTESVSSVADADLPDVATLKMEPLSPTSSISSRLSDTTGPIKRKRSRGRPRSTKSKAAINRKSYTEEVADRREEVVAAAAAAAAAISLKYSDYNTELSEEELLRDTDDLLNPGALGASNTGGSSVLSESFPNSPASLSICSDTEEEKSYKQWKKSIMLVWRAAATHKYANVFLHPVTDDIAPGYRSVVLRPMDLGTIKKNVETAAIRTTVEFQRDLMLMFSNAIMYNSSDHNVYRMATEMYDDVMTHIEIMVHTSDSKTLRQSRRPDASDKEEESKKRRLSVDQQPEGGKTKKRKTRLEETTTSTSSTSSTPPSQQST